MKKTLIKTDNIRIIRQRAIPVLRRYGIRRAAVFGSFARGEERQGSDVDLLVDVPEGTGLFEFVGLKQDLEKRLGCKVDLVSYRGIKRLLRKRILSEQIQIYAKRS